MVASVGSARLICGAREMTKLWGLVVGAPVVVGGLIRPSSRKSFSSSFDRQLRLCPISGILHPVRQGNCGQTGLQ